MYFFGCFDVAVDRLIPFDPKPVCFSFFPHDSWILTWIWRGIKYIDSILNDAIIEDSIEVLKDLSWLEIGNDLSNTEDELSSIRLNFELLLNLIKADCSLQIFPVSFG